MDTAAAASYIEVAAVAPCAAAAEEDVPPSQAKPAAKAAQETLGDTAVAAGSGGAGPERNAEGKVLPEGWRKLMAVQMAQKQVFPKGWNLVAVKGKGAFKAKWQTEAKRQADVIADLLTDSKATGIGVVTGTISGGLVALDIDGPAADDAYRLAAGDDYEPYGDEKTVSFTSGKPGRRQLLYQVPAYLLPQLMHVTTLSGASDGSFDLTGVVRPDTVITNTETGTSEELALRFNKCLSVLPGSVHPETKKRYRFLQYNGGKTANAPKWIEEILRSARRVSTSFMPADTRDSIEDESYVPEVPANQIRGWFFSSKVQSLLAPRLHELIFNHPVFDKYTWDIGPGVDPQMRNGCPWHDSSSGTSFQYSISKNGIWDCKACKVGGDVLDFVHKVRTDNMHAKRPGPKALETYVSEIATKLGFSYPYDLISKHDEEIEEAEKEFRIEMTPEQFLAECRGIIKAEGNPAVQTLKLQDLADKTGRSRWKPADIRALVARDNEFQRNKGDTLLRPITWHMTVSPEEYIIPGFLRKPSQVMIHSRGGVGKTESVLALAKGIGRGELLSIRGIHVQCLQGNVLWISGDQSETRLAAQLDRMGIDPAHRDQWFRLVSDWRIDLPSEFNKMVKEVQPSLIVIDSLGSVSDLGDASENDGAYAAPLYDISRRNGANDREDGFPSAAIIWIHHNTKDNANFRGTDRLLNVVDETWGLKELTEEEEAEHGVNSRILTIGKSRFDRSGDKFLVTRDHNLNYEIKDLTPTLHRMGVSRNGDLAPAGVVLEVLRASEGPMTQEEVREGVKAYLQAEGHDRIPKKSAIAKYLAGWVVDGMVTCEASSSGGRGRPANLYNLARAGGEGIHGFIDLDNVDTWPRAVFEFFHGHQRFVEQKVSGPSVEQTKGVPPESVGTAGSPPEGDPAEVGGTFSTRSPNAIISKAHGNNENLGTAVPPEAVSISSSGAPGLHAREDAGPAPERAVAVLSECSGDWARFFDDEPAPALPPEDDGLRDETYEEIWSRYLE